MFHAGSSGVDYLNAAIGLGGLLGAFAATTLSAKRLALTFGAAILLWGAPIAVLAPLSLFGLAILCLAAVGAANAFEDVALITLLQRSTPDGLLASVLGVLWGLAMTAVAVGSIVAPWVVASVGDRTSLVVVGLVLPVLALVFGRRLADIDKTVQPREGLKLIDGVPMYAPLSLAIKERVAASLLRVPVRAGETVVQAGGPGHRFYIVGAGQLRIAARRGASPGRRPRRLLRRDRPAKGCATHGLSDGCGRLRVVCPGARRVPGRRHRPRCVRCAGTPGCDRAST